MHEVIVRQYTRMLKEQEDLPNLIIADGGIQQVNAIRNALKEINLDLIIPVIGLAKNNKHQTINKRRGEHLAVTPVHKPAMPRKNIAKIFKSNLTLKRACNKVAHLRKYRANSAQNHKKGNRSAIPH